MCALTCAFLHTDIQLLRWNQADAIANVGTDAASD